MTGTDKDAGGRPSRARVAARGLIQAALYFACWVLFVGKLEKEELWVGVPVVALAVLASEVVRTQHLIRFSVRLRWLAQAWRIPGEVLSGTGVVLKALFLQLFAGRQAGSHVLEVPYEAPDDDAEAAALETLATTFTTMAPNFIVIGIDRERKRMMYHQVERTELPEIARRLGARP